MTGSVTMKMGNDKYTSKFVLADIQYEISSGTSWHYDVHITVENEL